MKHPIRILAVKSLKFILCLLLLDAGLGGLLRLAFDRQASGKFYRLGYTMNRCADELIVFGSSHATDHYVPEVLQKELGMTSYNAGVAGQQILVHEALQEIMLKRTTPRVMILDIDRNGLFQNRDNYDRLADLHPFYHAHPDIIGRVLALKSEATRFFLLSKLYQYNSTIAHVLRYWLAPQPDQNGYRGNFIQLAKPAEAAPRRVPISLPIDKNLVDALARFIRNAQTRGVRLVFVVSPALVPEDDTTEDSLAKTRALADEFGVKIFNFAGDPAFAGRYELFADGGHLNDAGARLFSKMVADRIREEIPTIR
jgi:hypothetical protein